MKGRNVREEVIGGMDRDERKKCEGRKEGRDEYGMKTKVQDIMLQRCMYQQIRV